MDAIASPPTTTAGGQPVLPPGFRFHPTDEELMVHYLKKKATSCPLPVAIIADIDLYKFDPWELPGKASFGEHEWYFFSPRDRKYPNGARPNRAATSGYWKATGTDKPITSSINHGQKLGVKKALVFYRGRPPKGVKTNWIMHEYRLTGEHWPSCRPAFTFTAARRSLRLDDWVLCRIYKKSAQASGAVEAREAVKEHDEQSSSCVEKVQKLAALPKIGSFGFFAQDSDRFLESILSDPESASSSHSDSNQQQYLLHGDGASVLGPERAYPLMYSRFSTLPCALTTAFPKTECIEHVSVDPAAKGCPLDFCCSSDNDAFSMKGSLFSLPSLTHQRSPLQQHKPLPQPSSEDLEAFWRCPLVARAN